MKIRIKPRNTWKSNIKIPGDKSISHRAIIFGAMAQGQSVFENLLFCEDSLSTINCLKLIGAEFEETGSERFIVNGKGYFNFNESKSILNAGNSGTTMRILSGLLCTLPFFTCITGDDSLINRPMKRVIEPLLLMGASIWGRNRNSFAPIAFNSGKKLKGIKYTMPVASAQVKSALLIAGLNAEGETIISEPVTTRNHTENFLSGMGANIETIQNDIIINKGGVQKQLKPVKMRIPGDISSAAFFLAGCCLIKNGELVLEKVGINETRTGFLEIAKTMGADFNIKNIFFENNNEPYADIHIKNSKLKSIIIQGDIIPLCIDELPIIAVMATQAEGKTIVKDAHELRIKETDRIKAIVTELRKMGADINENKDGFEITGPTPLNGAQCDSHGDHRIAMSIAVAGLIAKGDTIINNAECINISFPEFSSLLNSGLIE